MSKLNSKENRPGFRTPSVKKKKNKQSINLIYYHTVDMMEVFKVSSRTLQRWRDGGRIPFKKVGGRIYYDPRKVAEMMEEDDEANQK